MSQHAITSPGLIPVETNQESTMNEDTDKNEMSLEELAEVTGGEKKIDKPIVKKPSGGGQNDAHQQFQQILDQLSQQ